LTIVKSILF